MRIIKKIRLHAPANLRTLERYREVFSHGNRFLGKKKSIAAITRADLFRQK